MQAHTRPQGKPPLPASSLATRVPGMARPNVEVDVATLAEIDRHAKAHDRSRAAEIRVLLAEALAARGKKGARK